MQKELERRKIPDFFLDIDTKETWEAQREKFINSFLKEEYGYLPEKLEAEIKVEKDWVDFAGKADWEHIYFTFRKNGKSHTVKANLILPKEKENIPVFLSLNFQKEIPNKYLPVEEIIDTGFGIFALCYEEVTADNGDFTDGICGLLCDGEGKCSFGKISIWAYMASICMDYLCTRKEVDRNNVAIIGHSRLGKTALLCSALDERFKLTCANDSGCCGAAVSRGKVKENETIEAIVRTFPFWFCEEFKKYVGNEDRLPFDQHMLLARIAPRYLVIGGAELDAWADNEGQKLSCSLASKAWDFYGVSSKERVCYYERKGSHFLSRDDWHMYMKKFKEILKNEVSK